MANEFEDYWDFSLKQWVRGPIQRERLAKEKNLIDSREWSNPEDILATAERNRKDNMHATYDGYEDAVARALYRAENGYEFERTLEDDIRQADRQNEYKRKPL